ncbi:MAG: HD domain-containing protein [Chitinophagaceae bacterium]
MPSKLPMKDFVTGFLQNNIPPGYYYHNYIHTLYVTEKVVEIAEYEKCSPAEIELLQAAALWHDTGFINTYAGHEAESCRLARQYLPAYGYSPGDINRVCGMIMATKMPQSPQNKLETIIADADLEYLGTSTVQEKADSLFRELQYLNPSLTKLQWHKIQVSFLQAHHYFTQFCKEKRDPFKQVYLDGLLHSMD